MFRRWVKWKKCCEPGNGDDIHVITTIFLGVFSKGRIEEAVERKDRLLWPSRPHFVTTTLPSPTRLTCANLNYFMSRELLEFVLVKLDYFKERKSVEYVVVVKLDYFKEGKPLLFVIVVKLDYFREGKPLLFVIVVKLDNFTEGK